jgi:FtsH-binding integral membrane protein
MKTSKKTKLILAFIATLIMSLLSPILCQWYEQQTGIFPIAFIFTEIMVCFIGYGVLFADIFDSV